MQKRIVIALGGNALQRADEEATSENQLKNIMATATHIADIIEEGHQVIITHGNGPQVGRLLLQGDTAKDITPPMPMDVCVAMTQGMIGYYIQQCVKAELKARGLRKNVCALVTQTHVDPEDPAMRNPTKPVGKFYDEGEAEQLRRQGIAVRQDTNRGFRRVVPSPRPQEVEEIDTIRDLVDAGTVVVACGGGGVPVYRNSRGRFQGVEVVIDKDFASCVLAQQLNADILMILTEVEHVYVHYAKPGQKALTSVSARELEKYKQQGEFAQGSMLPKVEAALAFYYSKPGRVSIITSLENAVRGIDGEAGTILQSKGQEEYLEVM